MCRSILFRLLVLSFILLGYACAERDEHPFLARPALPGNGDRRVAFTARGRVWIGEPREQPAGDEMPATWIARPVSWKGAVTGEEPAAPADDAWHADRPVWLPGGEDLALTIWVDGRADLAITRGDSLVNVTQTPDRDELLDDVAPGGDRLLFESEHHLWELHLDGRQVRRLVRGRDGRYTTDGNRLLYVRGNDVSALGIWREGYRGGDQSDILLLDLRNGSLEALTSSPTNDENPVPLDATGRRYIAVSEHSGVYQPWFTEPWGPKTQRIRRTELPDDSRPVRFPAIRTRSDRGGVEELWFEQEGDLYATFVTRTDTSLISTPLVRVEMALEDDRQPGPPGAPARLASRIVRGVGRRSHDPAWFGAALFENARHHLARSPLTAAGWRDVPPGELRRFQREIGRVYSRRGAIEILSRLLGRFGLSHLYYEPPWGLPPIPPVATVEERRWLAAVLEDQGLATVALTRTDRDAVELVQSRIDGWAGGNAPRMLVLDLRDNRGGYAHETLLELLCGTATGPATVPPVIALVSEHTYSAAEVLADGIRARDCGRLVGRMTAGAVLRAEVRPLDVGGRLFVPIEQIHGHRGRPLEGDPVMPQIWVEQAFRSGDEKWLAAIIETANRIESSRPQEGK